MSRHAALGEWWSSLTPGRREEVLEIEPGDLLSEALALDLLLHGVHVPDVAVVWDVEGVGRRIVVHAQPPLLTEFLTVVRAAG